MRRLFQAAAVACLGLFGVSAPAFAGWSQWLQIPDGAIIGEPSVVVTKDGTIHVMARGTDNALWWTRSKDAGQTWFGNKTFQRWSKVGGILGSSPACLEPIPNVVECYVRNAANGVSQIDRINNAWGAWADLGGIIMTNVAATAPVENSRAVFGINTKGTIARKLWWGSYGWHPWQNDENDVGTSALIACSELATGISEQWTKENAMDAERACVVGGPPTGQHALIAPYHSKPTIIPNFIAGGSNFVTHVKLYNMGNLLDVYFVAKDKQMKRGTFKFGSGWTGPFETIANGQFSSGPSCDTGPSKHNINTTCMGRGTDGAVWYSFRTSGAVADTTVAPVAPKADQDYWDNAVLVNVGPGPEDGQADFQKVLKGTPSGGTGVPLKLTPKHALGCSDAGCTFKLGMVIARKHADAAADVEVQMSYPLNGKVAKNAGLVKMAAGMKLAGYVREVMLPFGSTIVQLSVVPPAGADANPANNSNAIIVTVSK